MNILLDLYTDFLQVNFGLATATGLSQLLDGAISHDKITRMLANINNTSKELWLNVKSLVRQHENDDACLIFDDSILHKPSTDENDIICWHYDHCSNQNVKGMNLLTAFYNTQAVDQELPLRIPVAFEVIEKFPYCEISTQKVKRCSPVTKNELMRSMIDQAIQNQLKFKYILADSWFASAENMRYIDKKGKVFIFDLKTNRSTSIDDRNKGRWSRIDELAIPEHTPTKVWLKDLEIQVLLFKQVFTNKDGLIGVRYLVSNDLNLTAEEFKTTYKKRWAVEEYHKSVKQNTSITKSPTRVVQTQYSHIFASILAYVKLEKYKFCSSLNHFAIKAKLQLAATKAALAELYRMKLQYAIN